MASSRSINPDKRRENMFLPPHFEIDDEEEVFAFLQANCFGQITSVHEGRPLASHLPFLIGDDRQTLLGHFARANTQWKSLEGQSVLITFQGPHDYISPAWYKNPGVPTWNYQAIHLYGECKIHHDNKTKSDIVDRLTDSYESGFDKPWKPDYAEAMLNGIVGFKVTITEIQCKYKLSQNKVDADRRGAIENLRRLGNEQLAAEMQKQFDTND